MNNAFQSYTTSTAFNLQLSKNMVKYMVLLDVDKAVEMSTFITSERALRDRGLVTRVPYSPLFTKTKGDRGWTNTIFTAEGNLVLSLLKSAGLYDAVLSELKLIDAA